MDKTKKKRTRQIIALVAMVLVVALLAAMPLIAKQNPEETGPQASILSGTVATGTIDTELVGGGTLAFADGQTISVPAAVKLKKFLVSNGDTVTAGTPIATVDRVTVMTAITQVQETLEYLSDQIEDASHIDSTQSVTALAGGTVKLVYAQKGDSVQDVMLTHGALAVLSLDGLMAVDLEAETAVAVGSDVTVTLPGGKTVTGTVAKNLAGAQTVTVEDQDYTPGDTVTVTDSEGTALGEGALYIYNAWNATAYTGTVSAVKAEVGDTLSAGKTLFTLTDVGYSATYQQLVGQRQEYEELMMELFRMYQTETLTAPCDGVVTGIDKDSVQLLSATGGYRLQLLANAPNGDDETQYTNYVAKVTAVGSNGWSLLINPQPIAITDYTDLSQVPTDAATMTQIVTYPTAVAAAEEPPAEEPTEPGAPGAPTEPGEPQQPTLQTAPIYQLVDGAWQQLKASDITAGDILLFAADNRGEFVWIVRIKAAGNSQGGNQQGGGMGGFPSGGGGMSGFPSGGMGGTTQEPAFELYGLDMADIASVTPQENVILEITVDEQDISALRLGMEATVKLSALGGEKHTATVTHIGNIGTNNGGSSKFTVELTMPRGENMLVGMNATAVIVLRTTDQVITVPADALVEQGNETVIYTGYDKHSDTLLRPVTVTTGKSDGETVEILTGLKAGDTYYYAYYDTLEVSFTPDFGGGFFG